MKSNYKILIVISILLFLFSSCDRKRITYVDIIKKEAKDIANYMAEKEFVVGDEPKEGAVSPLKVFFVPHEGIYMRIIDRGDINHMAKPGQVVMTRMKIIRFTAEDRPIIDNVSPDKSAEQFPAQFVFSENENIITTAPNSYPSAFDTLLAPAMQTALKYVGDGGAVEMILSFKKGAVDQAVQQKGEPLHYEKVTFQFKK